MLEDGAAANSTLNLGDSIDGRGGNDTLNLILAGTVSNSLPNGATIENVEVVNLLRNDDGTDLSAGDLTNSATYAGVEQLWQVRNTAPAAGDDFSNVTVSADVTAGFRSTGERASAVVADVDVNAATATQKSASVALDGVADNSAITFLGGDLETVSVSGSVTTATAPATTNRLAITDTADTETLNLAITSNTTVNITDTGTSIETLNAADSTGNLTVDTTGLTSLESATFGSGRDAVTVDSTLLTAEAASIDLGAGNDTITLNSAGTEATALEVTLGAGRDTIEVGATLSNITDAESFEASLITVTDFALGQDTIDLSGATGARVLTAAELDNAAEEETLADALAYVAGINNGGTSVFSWGGDAYVFTDTNAGGFDDGDGLIQIVGLNAADLSVDQNGGLVV